ncbi:fused MFS/spermidine synthase [Chondromyces crocatus]|uniref:Spermine/spermidine synthase n=1 Tax=Chondromyces crocatus TaxID=52 RepID=A0A0K1EE02_CHOCO|nr:fused MFS/spermidine synthase [Chondromyces crocatus]AKT38813.1 spermine/spermidine synthase [Chondromyces crocatus]
MISRSRPRPGVSSPLAVAALLFGSGAAALVYQIAWQREFRLIFGSSTAASAAVLAIFIGGTGAGSLLLGRRADAHPRPLRLYAVLELAIAAFAALSPPLFDLARAAYRGVGGTFHLGMGVGTLLRLVLAALVLGAPTVLMGGTLPAAARSVASPHDPQRRVVGVLYAANTLGAVLGCVGATFGLLEQLGTRHTLWAACVANVVVALLGWLLSSARQPTPSSTDTHALEAAPALAQEPSHDALPEASPELPLPPRFVLAFAAISGFVFFWMELVWYRMLGPLLGGSVYTFGLILAVALLGIGLGGLLYGAAPRRRPRPSRRPDALPTAAATRRGPTAEGLALTCALEALCLAIPFALGDRLALLALALRPDAGAPLLQFLPGWFALTAIVVLPAALVAGVQYPLLIALLGAGREHVGRHVGAAAACNTLGAMAGSLLGGFILLPGLTAIGSWRAVVVTLILMGLAAWLLPLRAPQRAAAPASPLTEERPLRRLRITAPAAMVLALLCLAATGPTAAFRHSPIGAGRVDRMYLDAPALARSFLQNARQVIVWETEGRESSVALDATDGLAMVVNGKVDGNARGDASTQIMGGLIGAALHPDPQSAMVIGFGTGSSAGWLAAVPSIARVDVAELEPAMREIGERCALVNHDALENPRLRLLVGDAREILLTVPASYDVIFSEPSNPYRAGIASLFTREYYEAARGRMNAGGLFLQWVQAYEIDVDTLRTLYATLGSVFPYVETWYIGWHDLLLVGSMEQPIHDVTALRARLAAPPYRDALTRVWRTEGLEGFLAHHLASPAFASTFGAELTHPLNTDDHNRVEFGFARHVGSSSTVEDAFLPLRKDETRRPALQNGVVDWDLVDEDRLFQIAGDGSEFTIPEDLALDREIRAQAALNWVTGNIDGALAKWRFQERPPRGINELALVAEGMANAGDDSALSIITALERTHPLEAEAHRARLQFRKGARAQAATSLARVFTEMRRDPWSSPQVIGRSLELAREMATAAPPGRTDGPPDPVAKLLFDALEEPFAVHILDQARRTTRIAIAGTQREHDLCVRALADVEPHPPWDRDQLAARLTCYTRWNHPLARRAARDRDRFDACQGLRGWLLCL